MTTGRVSPGIVVEGAWKTQRALSHAILCYSDRSTPLSPARATKIIEDLANALPRHDVQQYFASQPDMFSNYDHLTVAYDTTGTTAIGLLVTKWFEARSFAYLYVWTTMVAERAQRTNLLSSLFLWQLAGAVTERRAPPVIAAKTYSPVAFNAMRALHRLLPGSELYPQMSALQPADATRAAAMEVAAVLCPHLTVDLDRAVVIGGQGLAANFFPEMPMSGDVAVDEFFAERLTPSDQVLVVLDLRAAANALPALLRQAEQTGFGWLHSPKVVPPGR